LQDESSRSDRDLRPSVYGRLLPVAPFSGKLIDEDPDLLRVVRCQLAATAGQYP